MRIDKSLIGDMSTAAAVAAGEAEAAGFDGVWATESVTDAFLQSLAAIMQTDSVQVGTAIAVAFARNPMNVAYNAWDLAAASDGRFVLGLGTQVKAHIERRFSMPWSRPVDRIIDFVGALRAIWEAWATEGDLQYEGEFYQHTLMSPVFTPARHDHDIPVALAAVGPRMTQVVGEHFDGAILHGMANAAYLDEVTLPSLQEGLETSGRSREDVFLSCPLFLIMGDDEETIEQMRADTREQYAFYASTPAYRQCLEAIGYEDLQPELRELSSRGAWQEMGQLIDDDLLAEVALEGTPEEMPELVRARFGGRLDRVSSYFGWPVDDPDRLGEILDAFHEEPTDGDA